MTSLIAAAAGLFWPIKCRRLATLEEFMKRNKFQNRSIDAEVFELKPIFGFSEFWAVTVSVGDAGRKWADRQEGESNFWALLGCCPNDPKPIVGAHGEELAHV